VAVFVFTWNSAFLSVPADTEDESLGAGRIRDTKSAVGERFAINHSLNGDGNDGKHTFITLQGQLSIPSPDGSEPGDSFLWAAGDGVQGDPTALYFLDSALNLTPIVLKSALAVPSIFPTGTSMIFTQAAVPTNWTLDTTKSDQVIRVNPSTGGQTGGSWAISGVTIGATALTIAQLPSHDHGLGTNQVVSIGSPSPSYGSGSFHFGTLDVSAQGSGATHTHSFSNDSSWRPAYVDSCIGVYSP
jgi:hypothetical protein